MKKTWVADIRPGMHVDGVFVLASKFLRRPPGGALLSMTLADRTGTVAAVLFDEAEETDRSLKTGDLVRVAGQVSTFNGDTQIRVERIGFQDQRGVEITDFVESLRNPEAVEAGLVAQLARVADPWLARLIRSYLDDPAFMDRFRVAPAAKGWHHAIRGGLLQHTAELVDLAAAVAALYPAARRDFLVTGAFLHDLGKIHELEGVLTFEYSTPGKLVGHIVIGNQMAVDRMSAIPGFPAGHSLLVQHLILSHQGALEFASPVVPKTLEAILLHHLDDLAAKANAFERIVGKAREAGEEWSEYVRLIDRQLWAGGPRGDSVGGESSV